MPHVLTKTAFRFDELSDSAKEKARTWYRQFVFSDSSDWDSVFDDAVEYAKILGIVIDSKGAQPAIYFSGFSSQGDGASFEGSYRYAPGSVKAIKEHMPTDTELHRIAKALQDTQRPTFYKLIATCVVRGHYVHSGCMNIDVQHDDFPYRPIDDAADDIRCNLRDFADWIYKQLEKEYDYLTSNESVDEIILVNEYDFDENGDRAA